MKARIKGTNTILEIKDFFDDGTVILSDGKYHRASELELINDEIDWEQRRYEIVRELYCNNVNNTQCNFFNEKINTAAERQCINNIIQCADILIDELKK